MSKKRLTAYPTPYRTNKGRKGVTIINIDRPEKSNYVMNYFINKPLTAYSEHAKQRLCKGRKERFNITRWYCH